VPDGRSLTSKQRRNLASSLLQADCGSPFPCFLEEGVTEFGLNGYHGLVMHLKFKMSQSNPNLLASGFAGSEKLGRIGGFTPCGEDGRQAFSGGVLRLDHSQRRAAYRQAPDALQPPPPGVSIRTRSPSARSRVAFA
jgi:hypothetical protein